MNSTDPMKGKTRLVYVNHTIVLILPYTSIGPTDLKLTLAFSIVTGPLPIIPEKR